MTVAEAVAAIRKDGVIESHGDRITRRIKEASKRELQPAIDTIRREKQSALEVLGSATAVPTGFPDGDLAGILRGHDLELWCDTIGGRLFIVADEADALRLKERRGEVLTVDELHLVVRIEGPATAAEVMRWKRVFDGVLSEVRVPRTANSG